MSGAAGLTSTADVYLGPDDPSPDAWEAWHDAMLAERDAVRAANTLDPAGYRDAATDWSDATFRQVFLFMYDTSFYDRARRRYRAAELVDTWRARFGRVDSVLLWHAYPRLGFDERAQFDFYRDMPGGLAGLRTEVVDVFHARGLRVFVDYNPWAPGSYEELGEIVSALDADGVMLDTMTEAPAQLAAAVAARRPGVVLAPELRPRVADLGAHRQAWAQWIDRGDAAAPSILKHRWIVPRHRQFLIRRWDKDRAGDIVYSFWNGAGLLLWDNVFGVWNPYSRGDRRLLAETGAVLDACGEVMARGAWRPLVPTGAPGLDANHFVTADREVVTVQNRSGVKRVYRVRDDGFAAFWAQRRDLVAGDTVELPPGGVEALVRALPGAPAAAGKDAPALDDALTHFREQSRRADVDQRGYDEPRPAPVRVRP